MNLNTPGSVSTEFLEMFEEKGCNWNLKARNNQTPLQCYLTYHYHDYDAKVMEYLLCKCDDINNVDDLGSSAVLTFMSMSRKPEIILQLFIDAGADIHKLSKGGRDILDYQLDDAYVGD